MKKKRNTKKCLFSCFINFDVLFLDFVSLYTTEKSLKWHCCGKFSCSASLHGLSSNNILRAKQ